MIRLSSLLLTIVFSAHGFGQSKIVPKVFAPGVISGRDIVSVTFMPDGNTVFFCETDREIKHIQIMESHRKRGTWSEPKPASFSNGSSRDLDPFVTTDGKHLFFQSDRPAAGRADSRKDYDVYVVDRQRSGWGEPHAVTEINTDSQEVFVTASSSGNLYFASDRPGGKGKPDLYFARKTPTGYAPPVNLSDVNTPEAENNVLIAPDESFMILARAGDLYVSRRNGSGWTLPEQLPGVNTPENSEYAPAFSPDGKYLFYTSTRFENGKRVTPGTVYFVRLADLRISPSTARRKNWPMSTRRHIHSN